MHNSPELLALASGKAKLIRVTFPLGSIDDTAPKSLRLAHLDNLQVRKELAGATGVACPR